MAQYLAPYIDSFIWAEAIQVAKRNCREMEGMACFQFLPAFHSLLNLSDGPADQVAGGIR